jgi:hypothetical protein
MQYFAILTLSLGDQQVTTTSELTVPSTATRADLYNYMRKLVADNARDPRWLKAPTLYFTVEPNTLG